MAAHAQDRVPVLFVIAVADAEGAAGFLGRQHPVPGLQPPGRVVPEGLVPAQRAHDVVDLGLAVQELAEHLGVVVQVIGQAQIGVARLLLRLDRAGAVEGVAAAIGTAAGRDHALDRAALQGVEALAQTGGRIIIGAGDRVAVREHGRRDRARLGVAGVGLADLAVAPEDGVALAVFQAADHIQTVPAAPARQLGAPVLAAALFGAAIAQRGVEAVGLLLQLDVDHPGDGVRAVDGAGAPGQDLDPVDHGVGQVGQVHRIDRAVVGRGIFRHPPAVQQDQGVVGA
ncbi:hypothetical protein D3C72_1168760 [compost metagenome]